MKRLLFLALVASARAGVFTIQVVDESTGRGVPLVQLRTTNDIAFWTDSAGVVAFDEPGLLGKEVFFHVTSPGYEFPKDGFGIAGLKLKAEEGGRAQVKIKRRQIAERLYRVTGQGIYRDSVMAGLKTPLREPLITGLVTGQDTVSATRYNGKLYWFYGDTNRPSYPLGNFGGTGAVSELPGSGGLDPSVGVNLTYFTGADGFARPMFPREEFGEGLQWIEGEFTVQDGGREILVARVASGTGMERTREWHLAKFDDAKGHFVKLTRWHSTGFHDSSHAFTADVKGVPYIYLYPDFRVPARLDSLRDLTTYEAWTCMTGDAVDRDTEGRVRYTWKAGAPRQDSQQLQRRGLIKAEEAWQRPVDIETGKALPGGRGSVFWNAFRQRWVMIVSGLPGEIWFSEADTPTGPWVYARKVAEHGKYNFYNPTQHPFFDQEGGRIIYFEGTYTDSFSGAPAKTPRYDYNQLMYRLRLDDLRLTIPQPVYQWQEEGKTAIRMGSLPAASTTGIRIDFCAIPGGRAPNAAWVPIWFQNGAFTTQAPSAEAAPVFLALPLRTNGPADPNTIPLKGADGSAIARVWKYVPAVITADRDAVPVKDASR